MRVNVLEPFRVAYDGTAYSPSDTADVPDHVGQHWLREGWVSAVTEADKDQPRTSKRR